VLGVALDEAVDFPAAVGGHAEKIVGKPAHVGAGPVMLAPEGAAYVISILLSHVSLEKHLQCHFAGFSASTHWGKLSVVSLSEKRFAAAHLLTTVTLA
jgi:hypothetical protein